MKRILLVMSLAKGLFSQDSLFWFDMREVRDETPKTPKVLDKIFSNSQLSIIDSIKNERNRTQDGFRLQIFESSYGIEAKKELNKLNGELSDSLYLVFEAPLYKIQYGNFVLKNRAEEEKKKLRRKGYKNIWIVRSRIEQLPEVIENFK